MEIIIHGKSYKVVADNLTGRILMEDEYIIKFKSEEEFTKFKQDMNFIDSSIMYYTATIEEKNIVVRINDVNDPVHYRFSNAKNPHCNCEQEIYQKNNEINKLKKELQLYQENLIYRFVAALKTTGSKFIMNGGALIMFLFFWENMM